MNVKQQNQAPPVKFVQRLPPALHQRVKKKARIENVSMNEYVIRSLEDSVNPEYTVKTLIERLEVKDLI